jgi:predicted nucleic acid-binding protein
MGCGDVKRQRLKVIDTNIFIEYFNGNEEVADFLAKLKDKTTTTMNILELYERARRIGRAEINRVKTYIQKERIKIVPINIKASKIALNLMEKYTPTHGLKAKDSLVAGVCLSRNYKLITIDRHFDALKREGLKIKLTGFSDEKGIDFNFR